MCQSDFRPTQITCLIDTWNWFKWPLVHSSPPPGHFLSSQAADQRLQVSESSFPLGLEPRSWSGLSEMKRFHFNTKWPLRVLEDESHSQRSACCCCEETSRCQAGKRDNFFELEGLYKRFILVSILVNST